MNLKNLDLNNFVPKFEFDEIFQKNMDALNQFELEVQQLDFQG